MILIRRVIFVWVILLLGCSVSLAQGKNSINTSKAKFATDNPRDPYELVKERIRQLLQFSETYIGTPYRLGGTTKRGIDCSAFTRAVFENFDIEIPRVSREQAGVGMSLSKSQLLPGDLIFFATGGGRRVSHVAIVYENTDEGEIKFIHASSSNGVMISSLDDDYWRTRFLFGRRLNELYTIKSTELNNESPEEIIRRNLQKENPKKEVVPIEENKTNSSDEKEIEKVPTESNPVSKVETKQGQTENQSVAVNNILFQADDIDF